MNEIIHYSPSTRKHWIDICRGVKIPSSNRWLLPDPTGSIDLYQNKQNGTTITVMFYFSTDTSKLIQTMFGLTGGYSH